ncbi:uncharacterized protein LOC144096846 [Amblyomma americanum]
MQESVEMPEDPAQTGQEIDFEYEENLIPVPATIPCTLEEGNDSTAGSEPAGREQGTSGERCGKSNLRRKRPSSSLLRELMAMHQQAEERAAKAANQSSELRKQLIELQKESNEVQKGMLQTGCGRRLSSTCTTSSQLESQLSAANIARNPQPLSTASGTGLL